MGVAGVNYALNFEEALKKSVFRIAPRALSREPTFSRVIQPL